MLKCVLYIVSIALITRDAAGQAVTARRYKDELFKEVIITTDQSYYPAVTKDLKKSYLFDLYQPAGDAATARPLIIWMHGGGFKYGSKSAKGVKVWSRFFAQRGYVCVSINYRLSKEHPLRHYDDLVRATFYAVQDARRAMAYFKQNALQYGVDPKKIILGGNSAGGFIGLETAYANDADLGHLGKMSDEVIKRDAFARQPVFAVLNYWGAIYNLSWLNNAKVPVISVHGSNDGLVPITHKPGKPPLYGSLDIQKQANKLHIPNTLKIYEGFSHELQRHFNPFLEGSKAKGRWLDAAQFTADYLYGVLKVGE